MKLDAFKDLLDSPERRQTSKDLPKLSELGRSGTDEDLVKKEYSGTVKLGTSKKRKRKHKSYDRDARIQFKKKMMFKLRQANTFTDISKAFDFQNQAAQPAGEATTPPEHPMIKNVKSSP